MEDKDIKLKVTEKVNDYLKGRYIHIDGPHPLEEYGKNYVTQDTLRKALNMCFDETFKLTSKIKQIKNK